MTAGDFKKLLKMAGVPLTEADLKATLPAAAHLLAQANRLPEPRDD